MTQVRAGVRYVAVVAVVALAVGGCGGDQADSEANAELEGEATDTSADSDSSEGDDREASGDPSVLGPEDAPIPLPDDFESRTLVHSGVLPPESFLGRAEAQMMTNVETMSDGRITIEAHWAGALGPATEQTQTIADGIGNFGAVVPNYEAAGYPVAKWFEPVVTTVTPTAPIAGILASIGWTTQYGHERPELQDEFLERGVVPVAPTFVADPGSPLWCSQQVASAEDARGLTVRVASETVANQARALGMDPVFLPAAEMFEGLQRGVVDCAVMNIADATAAGVPEVATYVTLDPEIAFSGSSTGFGITESEWEDLGEAGRALVMRAFSQMLADIAVNVVEIHVGFFEQVESGALTLVEMEDDFRDVLSAHQDEVRSELTGSTPGEVPDAAEMIAEAEERAHAWHETVQDELGFGSLDLTLENAGEGAFKMEDLDRRRWSELLWKESFEPALNR